MRAAIFDLDGLLIDSEPLWRDAEVAVFGALGVPLTEAMCHQTTGLRMDDVVRFWQARFPSVTLPLQATIDAVYDALIARVRARGEALPGARAVVEDLVAQQVPIAVASSSPHRVIDAALARLGLDRVVSVRCSAEDQALGKPHPGVYLATAAALGVPPTACVAFEDSVTGMIAAKAARMRCVVVPAADEWGDWRFGLADLRLTSLEELDWEVWLGLAG